MLIWSHNLNQSEPPQSPHFLHGRLPYVPEKQFPEATSESDYFLNPRKAFKYQHFRGFWGLIFSLYRNELHAICKSSLRRNIFCKLFAFYTFTISAYSAVFLIALSCAVFWLYTVSATQIELRWQQMPLPLKNQYLSFSPSMFLFVRRYQHGKLILSRACLKNK